MNFYHMEMGILMFQKRNLGTTLALYSSGR